MGCGTSIEPRISENTISMKQRVSLPSTSKKTNECNQIDNGMHKQFDQRAKFDDLVQNFLLVWLDASLDESKEDFRNSIKKLQLSIDAIEKFCDTGECIKYISKCNNKKIFLVVSGKLSGDVIPLMHNKTQVFAIYIFCYNKSKYEQWKTEKWPKVRGVFTNMDFICSELRLQAQACEDDTEITGEIELSFKYSLMLKKIVLIKHFEFKGEILALIEVAREKFKNSPEQLKVIDKFADEYDGDIVKNNPIRWYTAECFIYKMVNKALGQWDFTILLKTAFFMKDLHQNIEQLYKKQLADKTKPPPETVFRGDAMTQEDFHKKIQQDKLMSYNNFLSTSEARNVAIDFMTRKVGGEENKIGVLFIITIDVSSESEPYARIAEFSEYPDEEEILFSTHTVFRVQQIREIHERGINLQEVNLVLISKEQDKELNDLKKGIDYGVIGAGWGERHGVTSELEEMGKGEKICTMLLEQTTEDFFRSYCYNELGFIRFVQGEYTEALRFYQKALQIESQKHSKNDSLLASCYYNIAELHKKFGDSSTALELFKKANEIWEITPPPDQRHMVYCYNGIAHIYLTLHDLSGAIEFYKKASQIKEKISPGDLDLFDDYKLLGNLCFKSKDYLKAIEFYEKASNICEKNLPRADHDLAISYNLIGQVYHDMNDYSKAIEFYEKASKIWEKHHAVRERPQTAAYGNLAGVYCDMGDYSKALELLEKSRKVQLEVDKPDIFDIKMTDMMIAKIKEKL